MAAIFAIARNIDCEVLRPQRARDPVGQRAVVFDHKYPQGVVLSARYLERQPKRNLNGRVQRGSARNVYTTGIG